ncbi:hypothetical protein ZIOFF_036081 [Zingiber officinale]|uniref:Uncharacterized protein n=1 Tax=Zingiber officinale TaxID=94328 RepID=A0A8J5L362_ZINOF|nr:hypothetical protein ZIOFF_036081 [Zingiber officinale]
MTTAARPTWAPAKGGNEQGGTRIFGPSQKYSSRDLASHTALKPRKEGQDTQDELQKRNLREELEERERRHFASKDKTYAEDRDRRKGGHLLLEGTRREVEDRIIPRSIDADDSDGDVKDHDDERNIETIRCSRWDDDVVFKNQSRGETKAPKRFINDTIRNDFHRKFLHKYMK